VEIRPLKLPGTFEIVLQPHRDDRGYFMRTFDELFFRAHGLTTAWLQENQSLSARKGILRGMHFQRPPHWETKLVRVVQGAVLDAFVDLRRDSPTHGQWDALELSEDQPRMVYIPKGFAHGFCTLTDQAAVVYKVDELYAPAFEDGLRWNDEAIGIRWPEPAPFLSARDAAWPFLRERGPVRLAAVEES
jgi:dTDP-4-dehydrorhamnose 3,5-epimerase